MEKIKLKIELISKKIEIIKAKLLLFSAGVAGCWAFISSKYQNLDLLVAFMMILLFIFSLGVANNMIKFGDINQKIDELEKELEK